MHKHRAANLQHRVMPGKEPLGYVPCRRKHVFLKFLNTAHVSCNGCKIPQSDLHRTVLLDTGMG